MDVTSALITYSIGSERSFSNPPLLSASGIKFAGRWVITHGSLVSPLKAAENILKNKRFAIRKNGNDRRYRALPTVYVSYENNPVTHIPAKTFPIDGSIKNDNNSVPVSANPSPLDGGVGIQNQYNIVVSAGKIKFIWKCEVLSDVVESIFGNWTIGNKQADLNNQDESGKSFLPAFVLIDIGDPSLEVPIETGLQNLLDILSPKVPQRGEALLLQGTPFGAEVFLNSVSAGLVSGTLGNKHCIVLCDAPSTMGCEGGPVYIRNNGGTSQLLGMTLNSISWCRGEWVGLSLVACLRPSLEHLLQKTPPKYISSLSPRELPVLALTDTLDKAIVLIRNGEAWGSGVSVGNNYFLTCSHVVKNHKTQKLSIFCLGQTAEAKVIYKTSDGLAYDLALLHASKLTTATSLEFATKPAIKGESVIAVGFPYFSEKQIESIKPTITKGIVSNSSPYMLQTNCCVQSGCSGGAIVRVYRDGTVLHSELLGIVVCNTRNEQNNTKYPNINMAIPTTVFQKVLKSFMKNPSVSLLLEFEEKQKNVQSLWKLQINSSKI